MLESKSKFFPKGLIKRVLLTVRFFMSNKMIFGQLYFTQHVWLVIQDH